MKSHKSHIKNKPFRTCIDCTRQRSSCYMVRDDLWEGAGLKSEDMLCIYCLKIRLGREMVLEDFTGAISNWSTRIMPREMLDKWIDKYYPEWKHLGCITKRSVR